MRVSCRDARNTEDYYYLRVDGMVEIVHILHIYKTYRTHNCNFRYSST